MSNTDNLLTRDKLIKYILVGCNRIKDIREANLEGLCNLMRIDVTNFKYDEDKGRLVYREPLPVELNEVVLTLYHTDDSEIHHPNSNVTVKKVDLGDRFVLILKYKDNTLLTTVNDSPIVHSVTIIPREGRSPDIKSDYDTYSQCIMEILNIYSFSIPSSVKEIVFNSNDSELMSVSDVTSLLHDITVGTSLYYRSSSGYVLSTVRYIFPKGKVPDASMVDKYYKEITKDVPEGAYKVCQWNRVVLDTCTNLRLVLLWKPETIRSCIQLVNKLDN